VEVNKGSVSLGQNFGTKPSPAIFFRPGELQLLFSPGRTKLKEGGQGAKGRKSTLFARLFLRLMLICSQKVRIVLTDKFKRMEDGVALNLAL